MGKAEIIKFNCTYLNKRHIKGAFINCRVQKTSIKK